VGYYFEKSGIYDMLDPINEHGRRREERRKEEKAKLISGHSMCIEIGSQVVILLIPRRFAC